MPSEQTPPVSGRPSSAGFDRLLLSRMTLRQMQTLVTVAEHRNILKASELLNMTQPAVSKSIKEMEATLGVALFKRSTRGVTPTEYGAAFVDHVRSVLAEMRTAWNELADLRDAYVGKLELGILPSVSGGPLMEVLTDLHRERPGISITIHEGVHSQLLPSLRTGELDMVVGRMIEDGERGGLTQEILYHEPWVVIARGDHPLLKRNTPLDLENLADAQWILPLPNATIRPVVQYIFNENAVPVPVLLGRPNADDHAEIFSRPRNAATIRPVVQYIFNEHGPGAAPGGDRMQFRFGGPVRCWDGTDMLMIMPRQGIFSRPRGTRQPRRPSRRAQDRSHAGRHHRPRSPDADRHRGAGPHHAARCGEGDELI